MYLNLGSSAIKHINIYTYVCLHTYIYTHIHTHSNHKPKVYDAYTHRKKDSNRILKIVIKQ